MKRFQRILVATDSRLDTHPIVAKAGEIARHSEASLKIVDVVPEPSWFARKAAPDVEYLSDLHCKEKKEKLEALAVPVREQGISVETKVLSGKSSVEIIREVLRGDHDLVMAVAKGKQSKRDGFFGHTAARLLRKCPSAVWLVTPGATPTIKHVLGCVDTYSDNRQDVELNDKVYELTRSISSFHNARFSILHAWFMEDEALMSSRLKPEEIEHYRRDALEYREKLLDKFLRQHGDSVASENVHMLKGEASDVVTSFARDQDVDLVVMGTVGRSGLASMLMGNTAERILDRINCSVLALKPDGFKSPVRLND